MEAVIWFRGDKELRELYGIKYHFEVKALIENCDKYGVSASQKEEWLRDFNKCFVNSKYRIVPVSKLKIKRFPKYDEWGLPGIRWDYYEDVLDSRDDWDSLRNIVIARFCH